MATFAPPKEPQITSKGSITPRLLDAKLGDGYSQRASDGLNVLLEEWTLNWSLLTNIDFDTITDLQLKLSISHLLLNP